MSQHISLVPMMVVGIFNDMPHTFLYTDIVLRIPDGLLHQHFFIFYKRMKEHDIYTSDVS